MFLICPRNNTQSFKIYNFIIMFVMVFKSEFTPSRYCKMFTQENLVQMGNGLLENSYLFLFWRKWVFSIWPYTFICRNSLSMRCSIISDFFSIWFIGWHQAHAEPAVA